MTKKEFCKTYKELYWEQMRIHVRKRRVSEVKEESNGIRFYFGPNCKYTLILKGEPNDYRK